jgi:hypothetical protein
MVSDKGKDNIDIIMATIIMVFGLEIRNKAKES